MIAKRRPADLIAVGLLLVIGACLWPSWPAITGVALIAWGATRTAAGQLREQPAGWLLQLVQIAVYALLVALFAGARWHAATTRGDILPVIFLADMLLAAWIVARIGGEVITTFQGDSPTL